MCRNPFTNLSFLNGGGFGGGRKNRKGGFTAVRGGEGECSMRDLVMVRT